MNKFIKLLISKLYQLSFSSQIIIKYNLYVLYLVLTDRGDPVDILKWVKFIYKIFIHFARQGRSIYGKYIFFNFLLSLRNLALSWRRSLLYRA